MTTHKVIIDTDPGIDDTMAIFYALSSPEIEVVGLTAIFGNVHVDVATRNALKLLEIAGRPDIPVAMGSANPLSRPYRGPVPFIHGEDGQGNIYLEPPQTKPVEQSAAEFIIDQVMSSPGEISLLPLGPLTNIALALRLEPRIVENVRSVVIMGGAALVPGNVNPAAEANIYNDPEAADVVFSAGWRDFTMVGLDVTHKIIMSPENLETFVRSQKETSQHISKIVPLYVDFVEGARGGEPGIFVHDPTVVSYLKAPDAFTVKQYPAVVDLEGPGRGKVWVWTSPREPMPPWEGRPLINVCVDVDVQRVIQLELDHA